VAVVVRIESGYDLIAIATSLHDHYYPSKSPTCEPKLTWCPKPYPSCEMREYVFVSGSKTFCRAPLTYVPDELFPLSNRRGVPECEDCPQKVEHRDPASKGTKKKAPKTYDSGHSPVPSRALAHGKAHSKKEQRRVQRRDRLRTWVSCWFSAHLKHDTLGFPARVIFYDLDESLSESDLRLVADAIFDDYRNGGVR
jgi:hypothetical protein